MRMVCLSGVSMPSISWKVSYCMETPDKHTIRSHLKTPNTMFPENVAEAVTTIFPREVLEEDGDLKSRMIGTGPFILKEHERKVKVVLTRNPEYFDKGYPYIDEY